MKKLVLLLLICLFVVSGILPFYGASSITIVLTMGNASALVPGASVWLDVAPFIQDGRVFVPLRFIAELLGATVTYTTKSDGTVDKITVQMEGTATPSLSGVVILFEDISGRYLWNGETSRGGIPIQPTWTGATYIDGMVQNQTAGEVGNVKITATYYDASGQIVGTDSTYIQPENLILQPGEKAPFDLVCSQDIPWDHYSLKVTWDITISITA